MYEFETLAEGRWAVPNPPNRGPSQSVNKRIGGVGKQSPSGNLDAWEIMGAGFCKYAGVS